MQKYGNINALSSDICKNKYKNTHRSRYYDTFKLQLQKKYIELLSTKEEYIKNNIFDFKCSLCNITFKSSGTSMQQVTCECTKNVSFKEKEIVNWLKSLNFNILESDRKEISPKELDIYLPNNNLAIEFNGLYWHSELNKKITNKSHLNKTNLCKEKNIQLIHIFENEWINSPEIIKSIILSKLNVYENKIYARKCIIKELSNKEYKEFIELNHIQGYAAAKYKIGLFYQNELVQLVGFSKSRFKKDEIELVRSCTKLNTQVVGGFTKLVKYFIKVYGLINLISYVDLRYFDGRGYTDWELINKTNPNYWYWKNGNSYIESRMKYQKHTLINILKNFDKNKTEWENMQDNGYTRIWDCGNLKFKYKT